MEQYYILVLIGEGSFGKVYKGRRKDSKEVSHHSMMPEAVIAARPLQIVALKFIPKVGKSGDELHALEREIAIMRALRHDNIVALYDWLETDSEVCTLHPDPLSSKQYILCTLTL